MRTERRRGRIIIIMITSSRRSRTHDRHFEPDEEDEMRPNARSINEPRESRSIQLEGQKEKMVEEAFNPKREERKVKMRGGMIPMIVYYMIVICS
jgi:hypothetical protein